MHRTRVEGSGGVRRRLAAMAAIVVAVPLFAAACGDGGSSGDTLPPIATTTTTTTIPATTTTYPETYVIQSGETLGIIAERFGTTIDAIVAANGIADRNDVQAGQEIKLPPREPAAGDTATTTDDGTTTST